MAIGKNSYKGRVTPSISDDFLTFLKSFCARIGEKTLAESTYILGKGFGYTVIRQYIRFLKKNAFDGGGRELFSTWQRVL